MPALDKERQVRSSYRGTSKNALELVGLIETNTYTPTRGLHIGRQL